MALTFSDLSLHSLAREYLETSLSGSRREASDLILKAARTSMTIRELYRDVIQPSQRELGALWETGQITVAQEHVVTGITQSAIAHLYSQFPFASQNGLRALIACAPGELHELGARMVADFLELEGWDVVFLGASTPIPDVIRAVLDHEAHIFGISATIAFNLPAAMELISDMRKASRAHPVRIVAGGRAFGLSGRMPGQLGADGYSPDAEDAPHLFQQLLSSKSEQLDTQIRGQVDHIGVTPAALSSFRAAHERILTETVRRSAARSGAGARPPAVSTETMRVGLQFTLRMLDAAMATDSVEILDDQLQWAARRLQHDKVSPALVLAEFQLLADVVEESLAPDHAAEILRAVRWLIEKQRASLL